MNILNYEDFQVEDLDEIIHLQEEIMFAFEPELKKRADEFDIDIYEDQMLLKDFLLTRVVEEITEAYSAIAVNHDEHYLEEIVDVFNFLIEAHILTKFEIQTERVHNFIRQCDKNWATPVKKLYGAYNNRTERVKNDLYNLIQAIGELTNLLKQRPWRTSQYPVDWMTFQKKWEMMYLRFFEMMINQDITLKELYAVWSKKYQVNKFRIESNY